MKTIQRSSVLVALCGALPGLLGASVAGQQRVQRDIHVSSPFTLSVEDPYGSVRLAGADHGDVAVSGVLAPGDSLVVEREDRWVRLRVVGPDGQRRGGGGGSLTVEVPRGTPVEAHSEDGDLEVLGTGGLIRAKTSGGRITVRGPSRTITAETVSGAIDVSGSSQAVVATSATGSIHLATVRGYIEVFTTDGEVVLSDCSPSQATVTTVSGAVHFDGTVLAHGLVRIDTYTGDVEMMLPENLDAAFEVSSFGGEIVNELGPPAHNTSRYAPGHELQFSLGEGSAHVVVDTFGGSVRLTRGTAEVGRRPPDVPAPPVEGVDATR